MVAVTYNRAGANPYNDIGILQKEVSPLLRAIDVMGDMASRVKGSAMFNLKQQESAQNAPGVNFNQSFKPG